MKLKPHTPQCASNPRSLNGNSTAVAFDEWFAGSKCFGQSGASTSTTNTALNFRSAEALHWEPKFPLDLVIAYEDETTRGRTLVLCDHLKRALQDDYDIQLSWWKFHVLLDPHLLERAIDAAMDADMIIVALHNVNEPSPIARTWIDGWLDGKDGHHCALVALVDGALTSRREDCPMLRYFNSIAHQAQMDFFSHVFPAVPLNVAGPLTNISSRATEIAPLLGKVLRRASDAPLWGINEY